MYNYNIIFLIWTVILTCIITATVMFLKHKNNNSGTKSSQILESSTREIDALSVEALSEKNILYTVNRARVIEEMMNNTSFSNFFCNQSITLNTPSTTNVTKNTGFFFPKSLEIPDCYKLLYDDLYDDNISGLWYTVTGTGNIIEVKSCLSDDTEFNPVVAIFTGPNCDSLDTCVALTVIYGTECPNKMKHVSWLSKSESTYYIYIHRYRNESASYHLEVSEIIVDLPINVYCNKATSLTLPYATSGDMIYDYSFRNNTNFFTVPGCISSDDGSGLWYTVVGTGNVIIADLCTISNPPTTNPSISITTGTDCSNVDSCIARNDYYKRPGCSGNHNKVSWFSELGIIYYIYIISGVDSREFALEVTESQMDVPSNLYCDQAIELPIPSTTRSSVPEIIQNSFDSPCGLSDFTKGVWYKVVGSGQIITAHTCNAETNFQTVLAIFTGDDCTSLDICVGQSTDNLRCSSEGGAWRRGTSYISWLSEVAITYYIYVHTHADIGFFVLDVSETQVDDDLPTNINCNNAIQLNIPSNSTFGDTTFSDSVGNYGYELILPDCIGKKYYTGALWYTIVGTGNIIYIDTCSMTTYFDVIISILTGTDCNHLDTCVARSSEDSYYCNFGSSVEWLSEFGTKYYIYLHGNPGQTGTFQLRLPVRNDCNDAIPINIPSTRNGTIFRFYPQNDPVIFGSCGVSDSTLGVWYSVVGTGNLLMANTCGSATDFDTILSIYTGEQCDTLDTCVASNNDSNFCSQGSKKSSVSWLSEEGIIYFIYVHGSSEGNYELSVSETFSDVPINIHCTTSVPLNIPAAVHGSTIFAGISQQELDIPSCANDSDLEPGMWYTVKGTGNRISANTCNNVTDFDMAIAVYEGTNCDLLNNCIALDDDECSRFGASVSWSSDAEKTYYIHIHGSRYKWGLKSGNFELGVTSDNGEAGRVFCFSGSNYVNVKGKGKTLMKELQIGDYVKVSSSHKESDNYSRVISFSHKDEFGEAEYLQLFTSHMANPTNKNLSPIEISFDHLVLKYDGTMVRARDIQIGDILDGYVMVLMIEHVKRRGLYAPVTAAGTLVVSGVTASSYVALLTTVPEFVQHYTAHALYAPIRLHYEYNSNHFCHNHTNIENEEKYTEDGLSNNYVMFVVELVLHVSIQPVMVQVGLMLLCAPFVIVILTIEKVVACGHLSKFIAFILIFTMKWMSFKSKSTKY